MFRGFGQTCSDLSIFTVSHRMLSPPRKLCSTWSPPPFHTCEPLTSVLPPPEGRVAGTAFSDGLLPLRDARVRSLHVSSRRDGSRAPPSGATAVHLSTRPPAAGRLGGVFHEWSRRKHLRTGFRVDASFPLLWGRNRGARWPPRVARVCFTSSDTGEPSSEAAALHRTAPPQARHERLAMSGFRGSAVYRARRGRSSSFQSASPRGRPMRSTHS